MLFLFWICFVFTFFYFYVTVVNYIGGGDAAIEDEAEDESDEDEDLLSGFLDDDEPEPVTSSVAAGTKDPIADSPIVSAGAGDAATDTDELTLFGIGGDLIDAFFADDEQPPKKKKTEILPTTTELIITSAAPIAIVKETVTKVNAVKKINHKKAVVATPLKKITVPTAQPTPALLEMTHTISSSNVEHVPVQLPTDNDSTKIQSTELTTKDQLLLQANKMKESENKIAADENEDNDNTNKNVISIISSSEIHDEIKQSVDDEDNVTIKNKIDVVVITTTTATPIVNKTQKKKNKDEDEGLIGFVSAFIDDDDETETTSSTKKTTKPKEPSALAAIGATLGLTRNQN